MVEPQVDNLGIYKSVRICWCPWRLLRTIIAYQPITWKGFYLPSKQVGPD